MPVGSSILTEYHDHGGSIWGLLFRMSRTRRTPAQCFATLLVHVVAGSDFGNFDYTYETRDRWKDFSLVSCLFAFFLNAAEVQLATGHRLECAAPLARAMAAA